MSMKSAFFFCLLLLAVLACSDDSGEGSPADAGANMDGPVKADGGLKPDASSGTDSAAPDASLDPTLVTTASGPVKGKLGSNFRTFLGIPYAAPPVGALRWTAPAAPKAWTTPRDATSFGDICPQQSMGLPATPGTESEDCLFLNVWTPNPAPSKAPVMVWIHGGGFVLGASSNALYNGAIMAGKAGVVLVSMNYRLGVPGFLSHPALGTASGNYGLMDQVAALKWVKQNIAAFGGDPGNVTIFGESAGGMSVCAHLVSPGSKGLFHRAAIQSGPCTLASTPLTTAQTQGKALSKKVGCDTASSEASCLRGKTAKVLNSALPLKQGLILGDGANWGPVVDGAMITGQPSTLLKAGNFNKVPMLLGANQDEGTLFIYAAGSTAMTKAAYESAVKTTYAAKASQILALYPASNYKSPAHAFADLLGDLAFVCPTRQGARLLAAQGVDTYLYHFTRTPNITLSPFLGAYHSAEIAFVFGNSYIGVFGPQEAAFSATLQAYWTRFATSGTPNAASATSWPKYSAAGDKHLQLDLVVKEGSGLKKTRCDFWDSL